MKDPLRYYLAEGWLALYCYRDPNNFGHYCGTYRLTNAVADKFKVVKKDGEQHLAVTGFDGNTVTYPVNVDFYLDYAILAENEAAAAACTKSWATEINAMDADFRNNIRPVLESA